MCDDIFGGDFYSNLKEQDIWREDNIFNAVYIDRDKMKDNKQMDIMRSWSVSPYFSLVYLTTPQGCKSMVEGLTIMLVVLLTFLYI